MLNSKKILIINDKLFGHYAQYCHHIWMAAINDKQRQYIFVLPKEDWQNVKSKFNWPHSDNIILHLVESNELPNENKSKLKLSWIYSRWVKKYINKYKVDEVILLNFAIVIPILPLIISSDIKISGIIYRIFLYERQNLLSKISYWVRYKILSLSRSCSKVHILNDRESAEVLNKYYRTNKFVFLPDPVPEYDTANCIDSRNKFITHETPRQNIFLHFGALNRRKGTILILQSILEIGKKSLENSLFIFAGKIGDDIKEEFETLVCKCKTKGAHIFVMEGYLPEKTLHDLCHSSDCVLAPYLLTCLSSGVIGWSAVHGKPLIGPSSGLIGELIRHHNLGITLKEVTPHNIAEALENFTPYTVASDYLETNTIKAFTDTLLNLC